MLEKIVSGGQSGVDQGALETAIRLGMNSGGFCPRGRLCENGIIPEKYPMEELQATDYSIRTEQNVIHSDGTLILCMDPDLTGGTLLTRQLTVRHQKPCLILEIGDTANHELFSCWIRENRIGILNIAGPRESKHPGIFHETIRFLTPLLNAIHHENKS